MYDLENTLYQAELRLDDGRAIGTLNNKLPFPAFNEGNVYTHEGHRYRIQRVEHSLLKREFGRNFDVLTVRLVLVRE